MASGEGGFTSAAGLARTARAATAAVRCAAGVRGGVTSTDGADGADGAAAGPRERLRGRPRPRLSASTGGISAGASHQSLVAKMRSTGWTLSVQHLVVCARCWFVNPAGFQLESAGSHTCLSGKGR
jgi:hypothetical protein